MKVGCQVTVSSLAKVYFIFALAARRLSKYTFPSLSRTPAGDTVIDFAQNMAGRIEVTAAGKPGDVIELHCFEVLDKDGNV